jgi:hypothetical protein
MARKRIDVPSYHLAKTKKRFLPLRYSNCFLILLEENLPKHRNPYCGPTNQPTDQQTPYCPTAEELNYSGDRARPHQRPTNNLLEVWQNLDPFGGRPINGTVEALLTKVINWQSSVLPIVVFFVAPTCRAAVSMLA